jgi:hypothetical protein
MTALATARPVPAWANRAAHLVSLVVLPSGLWRVALAAGCSMGLPAAETAGLPGAQSLYIVTLTIVSEAVALLTLGLVRPWGEIVPRRFPLIGGRRIPAKPVVAVAAAGAIALQLIWIYAFRHPGVPGLDFTSTAWKALFYACYAPLLLWAPLLAAVTIAYGQRRSAG